MTTTLASKIAKASIDAGAFQADKRNADQNYAYISADQVLTRAGDALAKQGIAVVPHIVTVDLSTLERQGKSPRIDARIAFTMQVTDDESQIVVPWIGFGSDYMTPDKAVYKAITSGHKYFLMKLLNIGVGNEDGEHETQRAPEAEAVLLEPMTIEAARQVKITIRGQERLMGELKLEQLDWLVDNTKNARVLEAAIKVREIDFHLVDDEMAAA